MPSYNKRVTVSARPKTVRDSSAVHVFKPDSLQVLSGSAGGGLTLPTIVFEQDLMDMRHQVKSNSVNTGGTRVLTWLLAQHRVKEVLHKDRRLLLKDFRV